MKNNVQLYINDQLVDLFDFEDINIVDSIQDVRDVSKIFIPFSRQFTVPASKNNNKIFKRYYNNDIVDGFDARFKISATITINGVTYKKGRATLTGVTVKNDMPLNYKLVFYSSTVDLKTILGEDMLSDINSPTLNKYKLDYNATNVYYGFEYGYDLVADVLEWNASPIDNTNNPRELIFPFISSNNYYYYDSGDGASPLEGDTESRNLLTTATTTATTSKGVNYRDLRGGIKLTVLMDAIQEAYPDLNFVSSFFEKKEFYRLYLYLQKERGLYESHKSTSFLLSDMTLGSGTTEQQPMQSIYVNSNIYTYYQIKSEITLTDNSDDFTFKVVNKDDNSTVYESTGKGSVDFTYSLKPTSDNKIIDYDLEFIISEYDSTSVTIVNTIKKRQKAPFDSIISTGVYYGAATESSSYSVVENMPKMKIIDFLTGLFKMFNLTAWTDLDGNINIEPLDDYYLSGSIIDVTRFIKTENIDVTRNNLYSEINFEFEKPSTFAVINHNEIVNDGVDFGSERMEDVNEDGALRRILAFDGGKYDVKPKFEKIQYERMSDQSDSSVSTDIGWGWIVDKDQKPVLSKPLLFYASNKILLTPIGISLDTGTGYISVNKYYRPSNSLSTPSIHAQSINFGSEYDEFQNDLGANETSLFNVYWKNTILAIYDEKSRITSLKANLPTSLINSIELNDVLVIKGKKYRINKLNVNITNGDASLELVTYKEIIPYYTTTVDSTAITVDSDLITVDTN